MRTKLLALIIAVLLILSLFCGCGGTTPSGTDATGDEQGTEAEVIASPDESGAAISMIAGFSADADAQGLSFPYAVDDADLTVASIGTFTGQYVEDGSDGDVQNVAALVVQNTSDKPIQYATVTVKDTEEKEYTFVLTTLPSGHSAVVLEAEKQTYTGGTELSEITASVTECDELSTNSDKVSVSFDGENLCLKNLTDTDFRAVYVRYKNYARGNVYLGGITYNATFETVAAGGEYKYEPAHFFENGSIILMVEIIE